MPQLSSTDFIDLIRKSGLIEDRLVDSFLNRHCAAADEPRKLATLLLQEALLTRFQAEQLLAGRWSGFHLGHYTVLEHLASGGMGAVFLAEHRFLKRLAALKVLPKAKAKDSSALARFYREAKAVAAVNHPNVIRAHDVQQAADVHFLVMEYVHGINLQDLVKRFGALSVERAVEYVRQAAEGLEHIRVMGMVHRDVKPSNLLLDREGTIKLLDLGLARFFDDDSDNITREHDESVLGTADYMAPEQALDSHEVDIRADVYSLGCTLYFLLSGRTPFQDATTAQKLLLHQLKEPRALEAVNRQVPSELAGVVRWMMAKEPGARPQTPAEVVAALAPWHAAVPPPRPQELPRLSPLIARRLGENAAKSSVDNSSATTIDPRASQEQGPSSGTRQAGDSNPKTPTPSPNGIDPSPQRTRWSWGATVLAGSVVLVALGAWSLLSGGSGETSDNPAGDAGVADRPALDLATDRKKDRTDDLPKTVHLISHAGPVVSIQPTARLGDKAWRFPARVCGIGVSPNGSHLVVVTQEGDVFLLDAQTGERLRQFTIDVLDKSEHVPSFVEFSPDGNKLAIGGPTSVVHLFDLTTGTSRRLQGKGDRRLHSATFSASGSMLAVSLLGEVRIWKAPWPKAPDRSFIPGTAGKVVRALHFSDNDAILWTASTDGKLRSWDVATLQNRNEIDHGASASFTGASFSADGKFLVVGDVRGMNRFTLPERKSMDCGLPHGVIRAVDVSGDGRYVFSIAHDAHAKKVSIRLWDALTNKGMLCDPPEGWPGRCGRFTPDGRSFVGAFGHVLRRWRIKDPGQIEEMSPSNCHAGAVIGLALSPPKESLLAATDSEGGLKIWNMVTRDVQTNWRGNPDASRRPVFSSDGRLVLHVSNDGLRFHQTVAGAAPSLAMDAGQASRAALSGDGRVLGLRYEDGRLEIRRLDRLNDITAALPGNNPDGSLALTPDGRILLSFTPNGVVAWEWPHPELRRFDRCVFATAAFSSDSKSFVGLSPPRTIHRIRLPMLDIERTVELRGSASLVTALALVDDQTLACGERSGHIFLLDLQTGKERRRLLSGHDGVASLAVSPDGRRLASGGFSGDLAVWDLDSLLNEPRR